MSKHWQRACPILPIRLDFDQKRSWVERTVFEVPDFTG
jgi:hypothetical protein